MEQPTTTRAARRAATAQRILQAAREEFGAKGFKGATVRSIAARAGVDSSLVHQHYGSKDALFSAATGLAAGEPGDAAAHLGDVMALKLGELPPETAALLRSMLTSPDASRQVSDFLDQRVAELAASMGGGPDAQARALLAVSSTLGLTIVRHFLDLAAMGGVDPAELVQIARPWFASLAEGQAPA
ncbi:helix-turn-helix transcriptional regulator [Streptacidiphilus sp. PB12-B1b]|uniref:TetR/AcrR family transcriptional regulator n=1 Tax=Streptacidiphilus sp. PB12-B1b TaxID=2705012 RepID=UPI0015FA5F4B|nr:TetR/AcrR family transcriptional regulator [Streptacidiphilus sp. PB12-B1b]QMU76742.1 helix-turn-helix transcriptional regulator [Streptacidiphilus sp. PB12-B1b]